MTTIRQSSEYIINILETPPPPPTTTTTGTMTVHLLLLLPLKPVLFFSNLIALFVIR